MGNGFAISSRDILVDKDSSHSSLPRALEDIVDEYADLSDAFLPTISKGFRTNLKKATGNIGTKVARLLEEISAMILKDSTSKCVVFSQYNGILDIASEELTARNIKFVRVDGNVKYYKRADALIDF